MKKLDETIDLTVSEEKIWKQINKLSNRLTRKPWYRRIFKW